HSPLPRPALPPFPTRRSSDLDLRPRAEYARRSRLDMDHVAELARMLMGDAVARRRFPLYTNASAIELGGRVHYVEVSYSGRARLDRKSTRLNSSHVSISYAVF